MVVEESSQHSYWVGCAGTKLRIKGRKVVVQTMLSKV
jgi:hypothetical protein